MNKGTRCNNLRYIAKKIYKALFIKITARVILSDPVGERVLYYFIIIKNIFLKFI